MTNKLTYLTKLAKAV